MAEQTVPVNPDEAEEQHLAALDRDLGMNWVIPFVNERLRLYPGGICLKVSYKPRAERLARIFESRDWFTHISKPHWWSGYVKLYIFYDSDSKNIPTEVPTYTLD